MQFGVRSCFNAPAHLVCNPELPLNANLLEFEDNTTLVADGHNSDPVLRHSKHEPPILRTCKGENLENN